MTKTPDDPGHPEVVPPLQLPLEISVTEAKRMIDGDEDLLLIDCREPQEYDICRIEGSVLIPMNETPSRIEDIEPYRTRPIIVHCHHGGRSFQVVQWLRSQGFSQCQNLNGGIDAWSLEIDDSVPRY